LHDANDIEREAGGPFGSVRFAENRTNTMRNERLLFVLPPDSDRISGGNIYNRELLAAVSRQHRAIESIAEAECRRMVAAGASGIFLIDTVSLAELEGSLRPAARAPGQRLVLVVHHLPSLEPGLAPDHPSWIRERATLPGLDGFLATSRYTAALLRAAGYSQPCLVVPPALPARPRPPLDYRPGMRALLVGNLIPRKGVLRFLDALAAARRPTDVLRVDIIGRGDLDPDHARACVRAAERAGLSRAGGLVGGAGDPRAEHLHAADPRAADAEPVGFRGPVAYGEMDALYRDASLFLSPSLMETFGMALQEARAFGLPILAHRGGNASAHVEQGVNGYLYDSIGELVDGFLELCRAPERMRQLFAAAQAHRAGGDYTWDAAAAEFLRQIDDF